MPPHIRDATAGQVTERQRHTRHWELREQIPSGVCTSVASSGVYDSTASTSSFGHRRAAYSTMSMRIFHSRMRTLSAVVIQSWRLSVTKIGAALTWCLADSRQRAGNHRRRGPGSACPNSPPMRCSADGGRGRGGAHIRKKSNLGSFGGWIAAAAATKIAAWNISAVRSSSSSAFTRTLPHSATVSSGALTRMPS